MSKRVLILSSSPRKGGNSDTLCNQFMKGAVEAKHHVERVFLTERKIKLLFRLLFLPGEREMRTER